MQRDEGDKNTAEYRSMLEKFPGIIYLREDRDSEPRIYGSFRAITGYTTHEVAGDIPLLLDIVHPDDQGGLGTFPGAMGGGAYDYRIIRKDGNIRWIHELIHGFSGGEATDESYLGVIFDITTRKVGEEGLRDRCHEIIEQRQELETAYHELKRSQESLIKSERLAGIGSLVSGLAHEINNPLQIIMGMAEFIQDEDDVRRMKDHAGDILASAERIKKIIHGLSIYSGKTGDLELQLVDINELLEDCIEIVKHSPRFKQIHLRLELGELPMMIAASGEMHQIFVNIFMNAITAMEGSGDLSIRTEERDSHILVEVSDTGTGIPEAALNTIFDPFSAAGSVGSGTGLGLYIVRQIIEKYGGYIGIDSREGEGTTVTVNFPAPEDTEE